MISIYCRLEYTAEPYAPRNRPAYASILYGLNLIRSSKCAWATEDMVKLTAC